jgi:hypothetical protein
MTSSDDSDWKSLEAAWKAAGESAEVSETALSKRLWRQRVLLGVQTSVEILSFVVTTIVALWMRQQPMSHRLGTLLLGWLVLQAGIVLGLRLRRQTTETASVLDGLDTRIERDARLVQSLGLGSVMSMLALAAIVLATATTLLHHSPRWTPELIVAIGLLVLYVFSIQATILLWARRVRRRQKKLEGIRQALRDPE